jgi:Cupin domain
VAPIKRLRHRRKINLIPGPPTKLAGGKSSHAPSASSPPRCTAGKSRCYNLHASMAPPSESELRKGLFAEGFAHTFVWQDAPQAFYPDHTHAALTAHIILDGEMTLTMDGKSRTFFVGDRCDVPAGAVHSAQMGPRGCRYLVGEK